MKNNHKNMDELTPDELDALMKEQLDAEDAETDERDGDKRDVKVHTRRGEGKKLVFEAEKRTPLMDFLIISMPDKSRTTVKSFLSHRQVSVNGIQTSQFDYTLKPGDKVEINLGVTKEAFRNPFLRILYEDDHILVVNKKNGLLTMATDRERTKTAYYILSDYLKKQDRDNRIFIVHRLDRETSGVLVFAKSIDIQHRFQYNWNDVVLERKYVAVVEGIPQKESGEVRSYLAENKAFQVYSTDKPGEGELAVTKYKVLRSGRDNTLMELELETGKKNQIRVHMSDIGHPIVGDRKYGAGQSPIGRLALHASKIRFIHPITGQEMVFDTGVPPIFEQALTIKKNRPIQRKYR